MTPGVRRLLSPAWILSHLLVAGLLVATLNLGFWQLRRLEARQAYNSVVEARAGQPVVPLGEALDSIQDGATPDDLRYLRVQVPGTWEPGAEVYLANRSRDGVAGVHVVALLRIDDTYPRARGRRGQGLRAEAPVPGRRSFGMGSCSGGTGDGRHARRRPPGGTGPR